MLMTDERTPLVNRMDITSDSRFDYVSIEFWGESSMIKIDVPRTVLAGWIPLMEQAAAHKPKGKNDGS